MNQQHQRRSIRLATHDYSSDGAYFVTICAEARGADWFGEVSSGGMQLNAAGEMMLEVWNDLPTYYRGVQIDAFVVMPDHIHGIVILESNTKAGLVGAGPRARPGPANAETNTSPIPELNADAVAGQTRGSAPTVVVGDRLSLPDVVQRFKSLTTHRYIQGVRQLDWPPFEKRFWQRNYWERVVRDTRELEATRAYIIQNPMRQWLEKDGV